MSGGRGGGAFISLVNFLLSTGGESGARGWIWLELLIPRAGTYSNPEEEVGCTTLLVI